jgi:hypothetical protein
MVTNARSKPINQVVIGVKESNCLAILRRAISGTHDQNRSCLPFNEESERTTKFRSTAPSGVFDKRVQIVDHCVLELFNFRVHSSLDVGIMQALSMYQACRAGHGYCSAGFPGLIGSSRWAKHVTVVHFFVTYG